MVKKIVIFFIYSLFFMLALIYFAPKENLYFFIEQKMKQVDVIITDEQINVNGLILNIEDADISFKSISTAKIKKASVSMFIFYNSISLQEITLSSTAKSFTPLNIKHANLKYSITNPLNITLVAVGEFGKLLGELRIINSKLHLKLKPSQEMLQNYKNTLTNLTKTKNGEFIYDKTF